MTRARLSFGEVLSASAGVVLLLATFLPWFHRETSSGFTRRSVTAIDAKDLSAWAAFGFLALVIVLVAAVPVWQTVRRLRDDFPARPQILVAAGAVAVTVVLGGAAMKLGDRDVAGVDNRVVATTAEAGLVVAAVAALTIAVGGVVAMWASRPLPRTPDQR